MKIETRHIPEQGMTLTYSEDASEFESLREMIEAGEIEFTVPVSIVLDLLPEHDSIRARGRLASCVRLACSRCAEVYEQPLNSRFSLRYSYRIPADLNQSDESDLELTAEQVGLNYFDGEEIDFRDAIQEQLVLAMPVKPLCSESCKGLCHGCGVDLNRESCRCTSPGRGGPFEVLKSLKLHD